MTSVIVRINPNVVRVAIEKYTQKTGIAHRCTQAEKAAYLDSHIFSKIGDREVSIGVQFEMLLRVMVRWVVFYHPQLTDLEAVIAKVRKVMCMPTAPICNADAFDSILLLKYAGGGKRTGGGFVIKNDLFKHIHTCWEALYGPLFVQMKNPSDNWLGKFVHPTFLLADSLPSLFRNSYKALITQIEAYMPVKGDRWRSAAPGNVGNGMT